MRNKLLGSILLLLLPLLTFAQSGYSLIVEAYHPNDINTIIKIWKNTQNEYVIRTSYSNEDSMDFDQEKIFQHSKKVEYDGFAKRVTFKSSDGSAYIIAYAEDEFAFIYGFYSNAIKSTVSQEYKIRSISKELFNNL